MCVRIEQSVDEFGLRSLYNVNEDIHQRLNRVLVCLGVFECYTIDCYRMDFGRSESEVSDMLLHLFE